MSDERFIKYPTLPFAEARCSKNSARRYKSHIHKTFSIGAIDQGEVIYRVEGETAKLRPGSLALINPDTIHSCNPAEYGKRSYYVLYLDTEWCLQVQQSLWQLEAFHPVDTILLKDGPLYRQFVDTMKSLMGEGDLLEKEQWLVDCVERIFLRTCRPAAAQPEPPVRMELLKRQLEGNLNQDLSMREMALQLDANPYTLLRQFRAATGITPHAYWLNCRIELAKMLLQKGMDVSQVALECGFYDQSHFHRHFKAITAVTPKEYQVNFIQ